MSGGWKGSTRKTRLPAGWVKLRASILKRDHYTCHVCGQPGADGVDHIIPGDDHSPTNLAAIHHHIPPYCHRVKSAREGTAAAKIKRIPRRRPPEPHPGSITFR